MEQKMYLISMSVNDRYSYVFSESDIEGGGINPGPNDFGFDTKEDAEKVLQRLTDYCRQNGYNNVLLHIEEHSPVAYDIRDRETGTLIDEFDTYEEALAELNIYERDDKNNGDYTPNFYEIKPIFLAQTIKGLAKANECETHEIREK